MPGTHAALQPTLLAIGCKSLVKALSFKKLMEHFLFIKIGL